MPRPVIYLDTQDFSRFGDVIRGKADAVTERLFLALETRVANGDAVFAVSMPILGELLQYDEDFRETTICKAQAVARLCGDWALPYPSRLIAFEVSSAARLIGLLPIGKPLTILSSDRYWYPNISGSLRGFKAQIQSEFAAKIDRQDLMNRKRRRGAKKIAMKLDLGAVMTEDAPKMASTFGLPEEVFIRAFVALLRGTITADEASHRLFREVAEPVNFVITYFERIESERAMPDWIGGLGRNLETQFQLIRDHFRPFKNDSRMSNQLATFLAGWPAQFGADVVRMAGKDDLAEFGLSTEQRDSLADNPSFVARIPAATTVGRIITEYARQISGLSGTEAEIERSFGGDLIHALYLPHVDLWRGDRRFSRLIQDAVPTLAHRVISSIKELPAAIDNWNFVRSNLRSPP